MQSQLVARIFLFHLSVAAWIAAACAALLRRWRLAVWSAGVALAADIVGRVWSRKSPIAMPHCMRWVLLLPRGPHSPERLNQILRPRPGETILEVGGGVGVHAIPVASAIRPDGVLHVLDVQQAMIDELIRRAARKGITNIVPQRGDAQHLPYADQTFDAAYAVGVLGEIPDTATALRELHRVLKKDGRLVISELLIDPDFVALPSVRKRAADAGFVFERSIGPCVAYSALFGST